MRERFSCFCGTSKEIDWCKKWIGDNYQSLGVFICEIRTINELTEIVMSGNPQSAFSFGYSYGQFRAIQ